MDEQTAKNEHTRTARNLFTLAINYLKLLLCEIVFGNNLSTTTYD